MAHVESVDKAEGLWFCCPKCYEVNGGTTDVHRVFVWFADRDVPEYEKPETRFSVSGTSLDDLTLNPSIILTDNPCRWQGFVTCGSAR